MRAEPKKADPELIKALAREARELLDNRAFDTAIRALHTQWYGELIGAGGSTEKTMNLAARLQALEAIPRMLEHFVASQNHGG